jgi:hypothetical protein
MRPSKEIDYTLKKTWIFNTIWFFYMFTFICKAKGKVVGLWSLNNVKVNLNFPVYTMIIKRAKKHYLSIQNVSK